MIRMVVANKDHSLCKVSGHSLSESTEFQIPNRTLRPYRKSKEGKPRR